MIIIASPLLVEYASFIIIIINVVIKLNLRTMYTSKVIRILDFVSLWLVSHKSIKYFAAIILVAEGIHSRLQYYLAIQICNPI